MSRKWTAHKFIQVSATVDDTTDWIWCADWDHYSSWTQIYVTDGGLILSNMYRGATSMWTDVLSGLIPFNDTVDKIEPPTLCQQSLSHFSGFPSLVWRSLTNMTSTASITTGVNWITHSFQGWTSLMLLWLSERKSPLPGSACETRRVCCGLWLLWSSLWQRNKVVKSFFYLKCYLLLVDFETYI